MRLLLLAPLFALACGPKKPSPAASTDFFPLVDGASWTYQGTFKDHSSLETKFAVRDKSGAFDTWIFLLDEDLDADAAADTFTTMIGLGAYRRTQTGLETADLSWRDELQNLQDSAFEPMVGLPPQVGASVIPETRSVDRAGGWTVEAIESVTVPAGTFEDCARLGLGQGSQAWLCPGVGLTKWVFVTGRVEELTAWNIPGVSAGP